MLTRIRDAITARRILRFAYDGHPREVEPYILGAPANGNPVLSAFQIGGSSASGHTPEWRYFALDKITDLSVGPERFAGTRAGYNPRDPHLAMIVAAH